MDSSPRLVFTPLNRTSSRDRTDKTVMLEKQEAVQVMLQALWQPLVVPIDSPTFVTVDGETKHIPANGTYHDKPLGKRVCILDVDTRQFDGEGQLFSPKTASWAQLNRAAAGVLSHYMYATIHGYDYKFIRAAQYDDRAPHWSKVVFTQEMLTRYEVVVMLDSDVMFTSPELPLEWMMNYWGIGPDVLVAMAEDPVAPVNADEKGNVNLNSGFIIARTGERTRGLFKDWAECPDERRYPGCAHYKDVVFHEQSSFSSFVRYDFLEGLDYRVHPQYVRHLPCKEANGYPEVAACGCTGQLVGHFWADKDLTVQRLQEQVMGAMVPLLLQAGFAHGSVAIEDYRGYRLDGDRILPAAGQEEGGQEGRSLPW